MDKPPIRTRFTQMLDLYMLSRYMGMPKYQNTRLLGGFLTIVHFVWLFCVAPLSLLSDSLRRQTKKMQRIKQKQKKSAFSQANVCESRLKFRFFFLSCVLVVFFFCWIILILIQFLFVFGTSCLFLFFDSCLFFFVLFFFFNLFAFVLPGRGTSRG